MDPVRIFSNQASLGLYSLTFEWWSWWMRASSVPAIKWALWRSRCSCFPLFFLPLCDSNSQGHEKEALQLMATYLPKDTSPGSAYQEGGGLYALGLIHANHGGDIIDYLLNQLKNASNDVSIRVKNQISIV